MWISKMCDQFPHIFRIILDSQFFSEDVPATLSKMSTPSSYFISHLLVLFFLSIIFTS